MKLERAHPIRRLGLSGKETTPICRIYDVTARRSRSTHSSETDGDVLIIGATRNDVLLPRKSVAAAVYPWMGSIRECCVYMMYNRPTVYRRLIKENVDGDSLIFLSSIRINMYLCIFFYSLCSYLCESRKGFKRKLLISCKSCAVLWAREEGKFRWKTRISRGEKKKKIRFARSRRCQRCRKVRSRASVGRVSGMKKYKEHIIMEFAKFNWISPGSCYWERQLITRTQTGHTRCVALTPREACNNDSVLMVRLAHPRQYRTFPPSFWLVFPGNLYLSRTHSAVSPP